MANEEHLKVLREGVDARNAWRAKQPAKFASDLSGADLYGADLRDANLTRADLSGARLRAARVTPIAIPTSH
jgi:uncharacterized protein YjbI with pentapeptide repeats